MRALVPDAAALVKLADLAEPVMSYKKMHAFYNRIKKIACNKPLIICAEDMANHPVPMMQLICQYINVPYDENAVHWQSYSQDFSPQEVLGDSKDYAACMHWYGGALKSTQFRALTTYGVDERSQQTFAEITDDAMRQRLRGWYDASKPYYELLKNSALRPQSTSS